MGGKCGQEGGVHIFSSLLNVCTINTIYLVNLEGMGKKSRLSHQVSRSLDIRDCSGTCLWLHATPERLSLPPSPLAALHR